MKTQEKISELKISFSYLIYCIKKDVKTLNLFLLNKIHQYKKSWKKSQSNSELKTDTIKHKNGVSTIHTKKLTRNGNWIPIITDFDGLLQTMKQNINLIERKEVK